MMHAQDNTFDVAQFYPMLQHTVDAQAMSLSYLVGGWPELEQWRILGRAKMHELLAYQPDPLAPQILDSASPKGNTAIVYGAPWILFV